MQQKYNRKHFLKLSSLAGLGIYFNACNSNSVSEKSQQNNQPVDTLVKEKIISKNVSFYKKTDPAYEKLNIGFNKRIEKYPAIIALPTNIQGVVEAIQYAKENELVVAVKSGGHCFEGFSSNNDGMMINLSKLNQIEWLDKETVKVGPACKLGELYENMLSKNRFIPAGSCAGVGVAGLTLGGGYGLFSRKYGLTCDSLEEVTMVDGNGNIINSKDDAELLWACKGGGNGNFGVIAEMKFKTHAAPQSLQSHRFKAFKLTPERATSILEKWFSLVEKLPESCFSAFVLNHKTIVILLTNFENETDEIQEVKEELSLVVDKTTSTSTQPLATAIKTFYGIQEPIYFKNASAGLYKSFDDIKDHIHQVVEIVCSTPGMIYQVNTLGGQINNPAFKATSSYPHRSYPFLSELQTYWDKPSQSEKFIEAFRKVQKVFTENGMQTQYRNYPDIEFKNWENLYYAENYTKLQAVKKKYDPNNLIRHEQSIQ